MERKDYADKFRDIKNEILNEIRDIVPRGSAHYFSESFYVHYIEGEVATTEICSAVEVCRDGMVALIIHCETTAKDEVIAGENLFGYDSNSFLDIIGNLKKDMRKKKDIREKKLLHLRDIVKNNGGSVDFDGTFDFIIHNRYDGEDFICKLNALRITRDGNLEVDDTYDGDKFTNPEEELSDKDLDHLIAYVESKCCKTMTKEIYLICCVDEGDNTKMVLCASSNYKPVDGNGNPLTTLVNSVTALFSETETTEEEIAAIIDNIVAFGEAETEEYSFFTEKTFLD